MILEYDEIRVKDISDFVHSFKLEEKFKQKYSVDIAEWDYELSDDEVIEELLDELDGKYILTYDEKEEEFVIYEIKEV